MMKSGIAKMRFYFFLWALDKLKRIAYNNYCDNLILLIGINHNFIVFAVLDIIKVGLCLLSRLQNPSRQIVDKVVADLRERYILRCRSRKRAASFYLTKYLTGKESLKTFCFW